MVKQNMKALCNRCKFKDIAEGKRNVEAKVVKAKPDSLSMFNRIEE